MNWRKILFRLHGWLGLNVGLLLFVVCFSGSFATLSHEIDWLLNPAMRVKTRNASYDWSAMYKTLTDEFPNERVAGIYAPVGNGFAALAYVAFTNGQTRKVYLDPYTGVLKGHTSFFNVQRFFRTFHRRFFDGTRGIVLVTLTAFALLVSSLSGFFFYKGWLKQLFSLRADRGPRRLWSDLHKTTGIWVLLFVFLSAATGVFYFVEVCFQAADNYKALLPPPLPQVDKTSLGNYGAQPELHAPNEYAKRAQAAFPGLTIRSLRLPNRIGAPVYLDGQAGNPLVRDRANKVLLHPFSGEVIAIQHSADLSAIPFITDLVDPLHFGYFGGLATKIIWCIFGLVLSFSILAGTYLWVVRKKSIPTQIFPWLRGATVSFILTLAYFIVAVFSTIEGIYNYGAQTAPSFVITEQPVGPYQIKMTCTLPCNPSEGMQLTAKFLGEGFPNYKGVSIGELGGEFVNLKGMASAPTATLTTKPNTPLQLQITMWDNTTYKTLFEGPGAIPGPPIASSLPDTPTGVWFTIAIFAALTLGAIIGWFYLLWRSAMWPSSRVKEEPVT